MLGRGERRFLIFGTFINKREATISNVVMVMIGADGDGEVGGGDVIVVMVMMVVM